MGLPQWAKELKNIFGTNILEWSTGEVHGPCPNCGGKDRLVIWQSGNAWCRQCGYTKTWGNNTGDSSKKLKSAKAKLAAWKITEETGTWVKYNQTALSSQQYLDLWQSYGLGRDAVQRWGLGYCHQCPTFSRSPSLSIPVFGGGRLLDIRHRLIDTTSISGKYRSHISGLGLTVNLFNRDSLRAKRVVIVEGEIKSIVLEEHGIASCGIYGSGGHRELVAIAKRFPITGVIALDPDVESQAWSLADKLVEVGSTIWISFFPDKPDDFILSYGLDLTNEILRQAQRVG